MPVKDLMVHCPLAAVYTQSTASSMTNRKQFQQCVRTLHDVPVETQTASARKCATVVITSSYQPFSATAERYIATAPPGWSCAGERPFPSGFSRHPSATGIWIMRGRVKESEGPHSPPRAFTSTLLLLGTDDLSALANRRRNPLTKIRPPGGVTLHQSVLMMNPREVVFLTGPILPSIGSRWTLIRTFPKIPPRGCSRLSNATRRSITEN